MSSLPRLAVRPEVGWRALLECASVEVVELMAGVRLETWTAPYDEPRSELAAIVGMAGALRGMTIVGCSRKTARTLGARMLGEATTVSDTTICDALGEICNMIAGNFKSKIPGLADGCKLSVPTLVSGGDFCLRGIDSDSTIHVALALEERPMWITLMVRS